LAEVKGLDTVLTAWRQAGINYPLKIVGGGHLQAQVREVAAGDPMIEYLGSVDSAGVADLMGQASFVVVPTLGIESFGRVVAEAMAKGTPPVVADHGGLRETVTDRKTGLLFPPGDAVALAGRVRWLLDNTEFLAQMRKAARNEFLERFTGERVLARWIDLYRGAAGIAATPIGGSSVADED
jgi:glycosyltransferase involved in cell wall biosynthesis